MLLIILSPDTISFQQCRKMNGKTFIDQLKREVFISDKPTRIVSLVPSITDFLHHLELENEVVGITKFCILPEAWYASKQRVGGTKTINLDVIDELKPDLIIGNKEENTKEDIKKLSKSYPVWMSDVNSFEDAIDMIYKLGEVLSRKNECSLLANSILTSFNELMDIGNSKSVLYFIWHKPDYVVGSSTYVNSILDKLGFVNHCQQKRYPILDELSLSSPDYVFLSSEPFPFSTRHENHFQQKFPNSKIIYVKGEMFSWYGSYMLQTTDYVKNQLKTFL
jgi:ABC-type Fe3+-hydroxamate transport system substrate-binding protein